MNRRKKPRSGLVKKGVGFLVLLLASGLPSITAQISPTFCGPPATGDWTVDEDCTLDARATAAANVIVENDATLTIAAGAELDVDFDSHYLLIEAGSSVVIEDTGKIY